MIKKRFYLIIIAIFICFSFAFLSYTRYLKNYYTNQQIALLVRLNNKDQDDWTYYFFQDATKEEIQQGKRYIEQNGYQEEALLFITRPYSFNNIWFIAIIGMCLLSFYLYKVYLQNQYKKTYLYYLEQIMNHHYQPMDSSDPILLQLNQLNTYFIKNDEITIQTKKQMRLFIEDIAHQIKTPLTSLRIYVDTSKDLKTKEQGEKQIERVQIILDALIHLAQLEAHVIKFEFKQYSITECFDQILEDLAVLYQEKGIKIETMIEDGVFSYDYLWLSESLLNIVKNAIEYSEVGGVIKISTKFLENKLIIEIEDNGQSISGEEVKHLFERFYTTKDIQTRKTNGMGIGLNIAFEVIKAHHGHIYVSNKRGCCFIIELPLDLGKQKL